VEITAESLMIAENAALILPVHAQMDQALEAARGNTKIGTTGRGIGPAYEDKIARRGSKVCDLAYPDMVREKLAGMMFHHNALIKGLGGEPIDPNEIYESLMPLADKILPHMGVVWK